MRSLCVLIACALLSVNGAYALDSPKAEASVSIGGKKIAINYNAPSIHGRKMFGPGGRISQDVNYPVWRAGANAATAFHTDADLKIGALSVPKGDYTLYVSLADVDHWVLIISKQTGQWGLTYDKDQDLGRVNMTMSKPPSPVETLKYTLTSGGGHKAKLQLAWDQYVASVPITVD